MALNLVAKSARRLRRRAKALLRLGPPPIVPETDPATIDLAAAMAALPRSQREVIVLHHLGGLPVDAVAGELGIPVGTVKTRLARGRRALAAKLHYHEEGVLSNG